MMGKSWKCPQCSRLHETKDNIKFVICRGCLTSMVEFPYDFEKETEVLGDGKRTY